MGLIELVALLLGIICVFTISYALFLIRPYSKPIVTKGKIVDKYTISETKYCNAPFPGGSTSMPAIIQTFRIVILSEKGCETRMRVEEKKYNALELGDPVEITEYSRIKRTVEKKK